MAPYIVVLGEVHDGARRYVVGDELPHACGEADDMAVAGAVVWADPPASEPGPKPRPSRATKKKGGAAP